MSASTFTAIFGLYVIPARHSLRKFLRLSFSALFICAALARVGSCQFIDELTAESASVFKDVKFTAQEVLLIQDNAARGEAKSQYVLGWIYFIGNSVDKNNERALHDLARSADKLKEFAAKTPEWCRALPREEYQTLQRVLPDEPWFGVYKVAPGTFAIYEPHQAEEVISYLIVGHKQALLFDTGMGIGDIHKIVRQLTSRPVVVLNSHTHDDHVGDNWQFDFVYGMDTAFTRANAKGSREDAQAEITPDQLCGDLPKNFNPKTYATKPWKISLFIHDGFKINLGGRTIEVLATPGHTPDAICLLDRENGLLFTGDTYYPAPIWLFRPETDFATYKKSIDRLAALTPEVKLVLGAHNIPVAPPAVLATLVDAFAQLNAGKGSCKPQGENKKLCTTNGISFLLRKNFGE